MHSDPFGNPLRPGTLVALGTFWEEGAVLYTGHIVGSPQGVHIIRTEDGYYHRLSSEVVAVKLPNNNTES